MSFLRALYAAILLAASLPAAAAPGAPVAARIDGAPLLAFSVDAMWRTAQLTDPKATRSATLDALIANRLLAAAARQRFGEAALSSGQRVGFARDVVFDDQLVATLRSLYGKSLEEELRALPGASLDGLVRDTPAPDNAALDAVFGKAGGMQLEASLNAAQLEQANKIVLLRYVLPRGLAGVVTLRDVAQRQNVQGRIALFARDRAFMLQQARLALAALFVLDWSGQRFGADAVAELRNVLAEQQDTHALMRLHGVGDDQHAGSALLDELAGQVSAAQVKDYYRRHREEFLRIEKVRARHIRLPDEASAMKVAAALAGGADFATMARRHSIAPDAAAGGNLGWVRHEGTPDWLAQLVFAQAEGQVSPPVRAPAGPDENATWDIVLVEQRVQGYQAADSESVRYVATRAVAREMAVAQLTALRRDVLRRARIDVPGAGS